MKQNKSRVLKASCLIILGLLSSGSAFAFGTFAIKGGVNLNSYAATDATGISRASYSSFGMGYMGGVGVDIGLGPVGVLADVLYAHRKVELGGGAGLFGITYSTNNIYVPIQARFSIIPFLRLTGGVFYAMPLGDASFSNSIGGVSSSLSEDAKADFGVVGGLGVTLPLAITSLSIEARYNHGLKNVGSYITGDASVRTRSIDMLVGLTF